MLFIIFRNQKGVLYFMDFSNKIVLAFIEEDNVRRSFFRVRPLLYTEGVITPEQLNDYPDEGFMRVVPDKNEQHTFKDRMRSLGSLCVLNLITISPDVNKIRSNKNYSPAKGEVNQFIIYSDAVHSVDSATCFYEVVSADNLSRAVTRFAYTRQGGNITGPVDPKTGAAAENAASIPPDSNRLFAVTMPDGFEKLFYWPKEEQKAAEKPADAPEAVAEVKPETAQPAEPKETPLPEKKPAENAREFIEKLDSETVASTNRLDAPSGIVQPMQPVQETLSGTRLYGTQLRGRLAGMHPRNPLSETVESQRQLARYEAPGAQVDAGSDLHQVSNPMAALRHALNQVWSSEDMRRQGVEQFLNMPGAREIVSKCVSSKGNDLAVSAMHAQLQDLEAERLMLVMQLSDAKKDLNRLREEAIVDASMRQVARLNELKQEGEELEKKVAAIRQNRDAMLDDRDMLAARLEEMREADDVVRLAPAIAREGDVEKTIANLLYCLKYAGFAADTDDAAALLTAYVLCEKEGLRILSDTLPDALDAAKAFAHALGAAADTNLQGNDVHVYEGGDAPALLIALKDCLAMEDAPYTVLSVADAEDESRIFCPGAEIFLPTGDALPADLPQCEAVCDKKLKENILGKMSPLPEDAQALLARIQSDLRAAGAPMPLGLYGKLTRFVSAAQNYMRGGIASALDEGLLLYVLPYMKKKHVPAETISARCAALNRMNEALKKHD